MHHSTNTDAQTHSWNQHTLLISIIIRFVAHQKFSPVSIWHIYVILHILLYLHSNISLIHLVVITQVILLSITCHQGLPSVHFKFTNTIWDAYTLSCLCYRPLGDKPKMSNLSLSPGPLLCALSHSPFCIAHGGGACQLDNPDKLSSANV